MSFRRSNVHERTLEVAEAIKGFSLIVARHLSGSVITELRDLVDYGTDMADLLEFSVAAEIQTAIENDRGAYDEGLDVAQERAANAAAEKLQRLFDAVGVATCQAFHEKLEALLVALRSTKVDLTLEVAKSAELDNTR